jgi:3-dehydroquinate dehydratase/shikimate dehydrogenase
MLVLCCSPKTLAGYNSVVKKAKKYSANLIEVRIENINPTVFNNILKDKSVEKIITFREEKINKESFVQIKNLYNAVISAGVEFIDIDFKWGKKFVDELTRNVRNSRVILSYHDFRKTPSLARLKIILNKMMKVKAHSYKISVYANSVEDNVKIFQLLEYAHKNKIKLTAHCMGELGKVSRILGKKFGSYLTYSSLNEKSATAAGQIPIEKLMNIFHYELLNRKTKVYGIIGKPLRQSKSWLFHNHGYMVKNINAVYVNFLTEDVRKFVKTFKGFVDGLSITIPYKEKVILLSNRRSASVKFIGSANTIVLKGEKIRLYNTDYAGMKNLIGKELLLQNKNVLIVGAGGTARALIHALKEFRNNVFIANRTAQRAKSLAEEFGIFLLDNIGEKGLNFDVIINATPGENKYLLSTTRKILDKSSVKLIMDVALNPFGSKFISLAKQYKCKVINGFDFFLEQAHLQFKLFTRSDLPQKQMRKYFLRNFNQSF